MMWTMIALIYGLLYLLFVAFLILGWQRMLRRQVVPDTRIPLRVSIIIPCRNEEKNIAFLLHRLTQVDDWQNQYEIICINDHSDDNTWDVIKSFNGVICLELENEEGKKAAITLGVYHASGDIVVVTDADCIPGKEWIHGLCASFYDSHIYFVCGWVNMIKSSTLLSGIFSLEFSTLAASSAALCGNHHPVLCNGASMAFRRSAFFHVNGYVDDRMVSGDDVFLLHKIKAAYGNDSIMYVVSPAYAVHTTSPDSFSAFWQQRLRWAGKARAYIDLDARWLSFIVFAFNAFLWIALLGSVLQGEWLMFVIAWVIKAIADFAFVFLYTGYTQQRKLLRYILPLSLVYWIYVPCVASLSVFSGHILWKGRRINE
ncbi:MAG: glycosyltransferase [Candidatus Competibacteraceae bacterium]|nr:glycosyltransferase [Candidatus Competibacteraceae bacterium]